MIKDIWVGHAYELIEGDEVLMPEQDSFKKIIKLKPDVDGKYIKAFFADKTTGYAEKNEYIALKRRRKNDKVHRFN